jgi:ATP-binding cassette subfamily B protein
MAERVQQVKGPGARPPRGVKPQVKNPMKIFTRIMKYALKDYTVHCIAVVIAIFVNVLANVQGTMFMKTLIDGYITPMLTQPDPDFGPLLHAILRVAGFYGIGIVAAFIQNRTMIYVSQGTLRNLRNDLFGNMEKLPIKYFDTHAHGDIMSIYTNDIDTLRQMISQSIPQIINSAITIVSVFVSMLILNIPLTITTLVMVSIMLGVTKKVAGFSGNFFVKSTALSKR